MVKFYLTMIARGKITLDDVPQRWREEVREALEKEGG